MGNEESIQQLQGAGGGSNVPPFSTSSGRPIQSNSLNSSLSNNLHHFSHKPLSQTSSMLNSTLGQLSSSFPNSIKPMNQFINQFNPGSFPGGGGGLQKTGSGLTGSITGSGGPQTSFATDAPSEMNPTVQVPEVDLSGLTEEEKIMIQSVMARAQEETTGPVVTPVLKSGGVSKNRATPQAASSINNNAFING